MKAISLWQPWASLWCSARKVHETRGWAAPHRGWLAVHAAKKVVKVDRHDPLFDLLVEHFGPDWLTAVSRGAIVGFVNLIDCQPTERLTGTQETLRALLSSSDVLCGDFTPGRYAWKRGEYRLLPQPIPFVGRQGFFDVPDSLFPDLEALKARAA